MHLSITLSLNNLRLVQNLKYVATSLKQYNRNILLEVYTNAHSMYVNIVLIRIFNY